MIGLAVYSAGKNATEMIAPDLGLDHLGEVLSAGFVFCNIPFVANKLGEIL